MAFSAIEKDGAMVVVEDSAATDENDLACMCWRQAFKCITEAVVDFWAHAADVPEDGGIWNQDMDDGSKCFLYWGPIVLCKPEDGTLGDLDGIDYIDECDGYRQALRCSDDVAIDRWILASASESGAFKEGEDCVYWGGTVPCLPAGATLGSAPAMYFATCEACENSDACIDCDAEEVVVTISGVTNCGCRGRFTPADNLSGNPNGTWTLPRTGSCLWQVTDSGVHTLHWSAAGCTGFVASTTVHSLSVGNNGGAACGVAFSGGTGANSDPFAGTNSGQFGCPGTNRSPFVDFRSPCPCSPATGTSNLTACDGTAFVTIP